jgi:hypothetical protein
VRVRARANEETKSQLHEQIHLHNINSVAQHTNQVALSYSHLVLEVVHVKTKRLVTTIMEMIGEYRCCSVDEREKSGQVRYGYGHI